ncbi:MAG TPA: 50S ribosomal protein L4, partial [Lentisphaeria bacterium]|nr:50S ribosomal protein L4 [Lentisphaeria bacterium]
MTTLPVINQAGDSVGQIDVPQSWVEQERGEQALKDAIVAHLGAVRAGTAKTKVRSEVRATGAKPYRQKGTGRARAGSTTSPIWRGGGTVFGPIPRSFGKKVNKKVQKLALRRALGDRIAEGAVKVLDTLAFEAPRTKEMTALLGTIGVNQNALILTGEHEYNVELASRNLPKVNALPESFTNVYQLLLHETVIFTRSALEQLGARIADSAPPKAEATPAPVAAAPVVEEIAEAPVEEVVEEVVEEAAEAPVV